MNVDDQKIIKKIKIEQNFSDVVFKSARAERFGITYCCPLDVDRVTNKKELCDWEESQSLVASIPCDAMITEIGIVFETELNEIMVIE